MTGLTHKALTGISVVFALLAMFLGLTALPTFLGLSGVLPRPAGPEEIADALGRLVLALVFVSGMFAAEWAQNKITGGET